ncbi:unnamed protein product [Amoebophrya sp. A120]|nr:unnamed protein product [Amoebophrya sp. A120]|eukprot:GSA120T00009814001.1
MSLSGNNKLAKVAAATAVLAATAGAVSTKNEVKAKKNLKTLIMKSKAAAAAGASSKKVSKKTTWDDKAMMDMYLAAVDTHSQAFKDAVEANCEFHEEKLKEEGCCKAGADMNEGIDGITTAGLFKCDDVREIQKNYGCNPCTAASSSRSGSGSGSKKTMHCKYRRPGGLQKGRSLSCRLCIVSMSQKVV